METISDSDSATHELTRTSEALDEQREWLRVTLASIGDAVITTDTEGCVTFLNPVAESLTGWTLKEAACVPLDTIFKIVNEETRGTVESPVTKALREGLVVGLANHTILIARDGIERPIDDSAAPIRNAKSEVAGVVLVFRDVTERRRAERALRDSEERFRLLVEAVQDYAIFMLDPQGNVVSWNTGAERMKGYRADEIIGKHFSHFYPPEAADVGWPQKESEFIIRLPVVVPTSTKLSSLPASRASKSAQVLRVLVVDDNRDSADALAMLLRVSGHEVRMAYSGKSALEAALEFQPNAVVLDLGLPEMDGYEVARRLRQNPQLKNVRLIAASGYGQAADRQRCQEAGFDAHLVKPVDFEKLKELLGDVSQ